MNRDYRDPEALAEAVAETKAKKHKITLELTDAQYDRLKDLKDFRDGLIKEDSVLVRDARAAVAEIKNHKLTSEVAVGVGVSAVVSETEESIIQMVLGALL